MSVYTHLESEDLVQLLSHYCVGTLKNFEGISAGVSNTNYFVDTTNQVEDTRFVLTIFEKNTLEEMHFFIDLMHHLSSNGVSTPQPIADKHGQFLHTLKGKPAALVECLSGTDPKQPNNAQIAAIGKAMANMHLKGADFPKHRPNCRSLAWWNESLAQLENKLSPEDLALAKDEIAQQTAFDGHSLPSGVIHADLFSDNALFDGDALTGIIDLYFACNDLFVYDIAVTLNDWCTNEQGELSLEKVQLFLSAYESVRALGPEERNALPMMMRRAALRFWLSRLMDFHFPDEDAIGQIKDPDSIKNILINRRHHPDLLKTI